MSNNKWTGWSGSLAYIESFEKALDEIWVIVHRPSKDHPKGNHAYTHFMADFDQIRTIVKPFVKEESPK